jgi:hypothetical protein
MAEHTKTPYTIATLTETNTDTIVLGNNNATVCETFYYWRDKKECESNAEFIVKACNNYDKLVEVLKYVYELYGGGWSKNAQTKVADILRECE